MTAQEPSGTLSRKPYEPAIHCEEVITGRACQGSPQRTLAIYPTEMRGGLPKFAYRSHRPIATLLADHKARGLCSSHPKSDRVDAPRAGDAYGDEAIVACQLVAPARAFPIA